MRSCMCLRTPSCLFFAYFLFCFSFFLSFFFSLLFELHVITQTDRSEMVKIWTAHIYSNDTMRFGYFENGIQRHRRNVVKRINDTKYMCLCSMQCAVCTVHKETRYPIDIMIMYKTEKYVSNVNGCRDVLQIVAITEHDEQRLSNGKLFEIHFCLFLVFFCWFYCCGEEFCVRPR